MGTTEGGSVAGGCTAACETGGAALALPSGPADCGTRESFRGPSIDTTASSIRTTTSSTALSTRPKAEIILMKITINIKGKSKKRTMQLYRNILIRNTRRSFIITVYVLFSNGVAE
jgi:hypothetical protein